MKSVSLSSVLADLEKDKIISPQSSAILRTEERQVLVPQMTASGDDPVFAAIVVDSSPSMEPYRDAVIQGQNQLLDVLRGSSLCRRNALLVAQYLFNATLKQLKEFSPLRPDGKDEVPKLNTSNYTFEPCTALYQSVFEVLQDLVVFIDVSRKEFYSATFDIAVITDGDNNHGDIEPEKVSILMKELKAKGYMRRSIVIGLIGTDLTMDRFSEIQQILGFDEAIPLSQSASEIRRAFDMVSKSIARG
jgi:hypothetical protein